MPGRVLIVDSVSSNRIVMRARLSAAFFDVVQACDGRDAIGQINRGAPSLAIIAADLPDMSGIALCQRIRARHPVGTLPIIMVARTLDTCQRLDALQAGADVVLERPLNEALLLSRIRCLLRATGGMEELRLREGSNRALGLSEAAQGFHGPGRIAIIGGPEQRANLLAGSLNDRLIHRVDRAQGLDLLRSSNRRGRPDLGIVLLSNAADDNGLHVIAALRAQPETRNLAIMALLAEDDDALMAEALDHGANDAMALAGPKAELDLRLERLIVGKRRADRLRDTVHDGLRAAVTDPLTGLYNRRHALPQLGRMAQEACDHGESLAVMIADLDHFKSVNDRFGHAAGDAVLKKVAQRLRTALRPGDLLARIGGEEFLIAMPRLSCHDAQAAARMLCRAVGKSPIPVAGCPATIRQTVSVGLAMSGHTSAVPSGEALLEQADRALYSAKSCGRNTVTLAEQSAA